MSFGRKLRILRAFHELDQRAMSKKLNISQPVYSRYENDAKRIYINDPFVMRVADIFEVPLIWLCDEAEKQLFDLRGVLIKKNTAEQDIPPEVQKLLRRHEKLSRQVLTIIRKNKVQAGMNNIQV